jgi:hypothetical protein
MGSDEHLKQRLAATPTNLPGFVGDLGDVARRMTRRRRHRLIATIVACVVVGLGVVIPLAAITPLANHGPAPVGSSPTVTSSPTPSPPPNPFTRPPLRYVSLVSQRVVSSSTDRLVIEGPVGVARWSLNGCSVTGGPANINRHRSGGFGSGSCGNGTQLSAGVGGLMICPKICSSSVTGTFYDVISGRTLPNSGVHIAVTFHDGTTTTVTPSLGLWMVVFRPHPAIYNPTSPIAIVRAIAMDGTILATERV